MPCHSGHSFDDPDAPEGWYDDPEDDYDADTYDTGDDWIPEYHYDYEPLSRYRRFRIWLMLAIHKVKMRADRVYAKSINDIPF